MAIAGQSSVYTYILLYILQRDGVPLALGCTSLQPEATLETDPSCVDLQNHRDSQDLDRYGNLEDGEVLMQSWMQAKTEGSADNPIGMKKRKASTLSDIAASSSSSLPSTSSASSSISGIPPST